MESSSHRTRKRVGAVGGAPSSGSNWVNPSPNSAALQALSSMRPSMRSGPDRRAALILRKKLAAPAGDGPVCGGAASAGPETTASASSGLSMRRSTSVEPNGGPLPGISPPRCGRAAFWYTAGVAEPVQVVSEIPSTPMLRQYQEAKAQAKDALLFFRLGDFYELFYDDARVAAQLLGITLTSRAKGDDRVPMAGVPHHAAKGYVARLVAAGYKVALCDQVEVPGPGKQLVRREIVRLVTPGTVFDEEDAREPVWLGAVALEGERAAVALLDASTGELRALQPGGVESALDELQRAQPRELLLPEELLGTPLEEALKKASGAVRIEGRAPRGPAEAQRFLQRHLGVATLDGFGLREPLSVQAAAEALSYLQETQRSAAQHVVRVQVEQPAQALWIDPSAVRNLELFRGPDGRRTGTLLSVVDRTLTAAGSRTPSRSCRRRRWRARRSPTRCGACSTWSVCSAGWRWARARRATWPGCAPRCSGCRRWRSGSRLAPRRACAISPLRSVPRPTCARSSTGRSPTRSQPGANPASSGRGTGATWTSWPIWPRAAGPPSRRSRRRSGRAPGSSRSRSATTGSPASTSRSPSPTCTWSRATTSGARPRSARSGSSCPLSPSTRRASCPPKSAGRRWSSRSSTSCARRCWLAAPTCAPALRRRRRWMRCSRSRASPRSRAGCGRWSMGRT